MATDLDKSNNRARLWGLTTIGMTMGIWDMVEESASSLSPQIGAQILGMVEKQLGLEIAGEKPEELFVDLGRIFVDEYGFASEAKVDRADKVIHVSFKNSVGTPEFAMAKKQGVEKLFSHPFLCTGLAALSKLGLKSRGSVEVDPDTRGTVVTFELL
jgi:hypothetical protein